MPIGAVLLRLGLVAADDVADALDDDLLGEELGLRAPLARHEERYEGLGVVEHRLAYALVGALAHAACREGVTVLYKRLPRLFEDLDLAHGDGRFPKIFRAITRTQLLILDDWGPDTLTATQRRDLMEIVEERYGRGSTMITSQLPVSGWHEVIGEPTFADATLDRIVHNAYRIELDGASMRKTIARKDDEHPKI